jgi:hypothetical protein
LVLKRGLTKKIFIILNTNNARPSKAFGMGLRPEKVLKIREGFLKEVMKGDRQVFLCRFVRRK